MKFGISQTPGNGLGVAVESMGLISYQRAYRQVIANSSFGSVTYPLMMAVISVTRGKVTVRDFKTEYLFTRCFSNNATKPRNDHEIYSIPYKEH